MSDIRGILHSKCFVGETAMSNCIKHCRSIGFSELEPSWAVDQMHNSKSAVTMYPFIAATQNRRAKLILENALAAARVSIRLAGGWACFASP
jgi:hypothetical protein